MGISADIQRGLANSVHFRPWVVETRACLEAAEAQQAAQGVADVRLALVVFCRSGVHRSVALSELLARVLTDRQLSREPVQVG
ncbi:MAG: hypothetical protein GY772_26970 [bacterium]|nr:hypothetical protein [bacterium]